MKGDVIAGRISDLGDRHRLCVGRRHVDADRPRRHVLLFARKLIFLFYAGFCRRDRTAAARLQDHYSWLLVAPAGAAVRCLVLFPVPFLRDMHQPAY